MPKPELFVSCGQRTAEEKRLAAAICAQIREHATFDYFFAEFQHNLSGLNENILDALDRAVGFITVLHGRGGVVYDGGSGVALIRASVWIEQEIAIAAFIQRNAQKTLLTAAYIEKGVGREGLRDLLHLNPTEFNDPNEVVTDLRERLRSWAVPNLQNYLSEDSDGKVELKFAPGYESGVRVKHLTPILTSKRSRAKEYSCSLELPDALLSWNNAVFIIRTQSTRPGYSRFRISEQNKQGAFIHRGDSVEMFTIQASVDHLKSDQRDVVYKQPIYVSAELGEKSYTLEVLCGQIF